MALFGYARVSTDEQTKGASLDEQRATLSAYGVPVGNIFVDEGVSGAKPLVKRPAGGELLDRLTRDDTVVATKMDRIFRDARDALNQVHTFKDAGIHVVLLDVGHDPVNGNGVAKMFFTMMAGIAEFERSRIAERILEGKKAKAARGGFTGGKTPFGWRKVGGHRDERLVPVKREQDALKDIMRMRSGPKPANFSTIATVLQADGFEISRETVRRICNRTEGRQPRKRRKKGSLK